MANINVNPNIPLQRNQPVQVPAKSSSYLGNLLNTVYLGMRRPIDHAWYKRSPSDNPSRALKRIDEASERGLQIAKTRGVPLEPIAPRLHGEIDQILEIQGKANRIEAMNRAEVGEVANIHPLEPDAEVTRAPDPQARVDATDWKVQIVVQRVNLSRKLSAFTALMQMRDRCGRKDENNLGLMNLVKRATEGPNPPTIWELFTSHYDLSFFEKIQAAWFYWIYYQTSLISNTVSAYLVSFIDEITKDLTQKNSETRSLVISGVLQNANEFLIEDIQAARDFSNGVDHGGLDKYQDRAIERHYGFSLTELCKKFSEKRVDQSDTRVPFFEAFQQIPVIGWGFKGFEWFVNRFIIQKAMKTWILPNALESGVNKGLEATQPHNLPFTLSLTRFFTQRLEQLQEKIKDGTEAPKAETKFPGTELLSPTIKLLLQALSLEGLKTPKELRDKFAEIERGKNTADKKIEDGIEEGIVEASDLLFKYLNETAESGELFAKLLELSVAPFSGEAKEQALLEAEYKEEKAKLERTARTVFQEISRQAITRIINGPKTEDSQQVAASSFENQKKITDKTVEELNVVCTRMAAKVEQSRVAPAPENNVQTDIGSVLQTLQVLASRKELQDKLVGVKPVDQDAIWRALTPLLTRAEEIQGHVLKLQKLQDHYPAHAAVVTHLTEMKELLRSIRDQFHAQPRHLQNPLIQSLGKTADEITKCLGTKSLVHLKLQAFITQISQLSDSIVKEQQVIDAIQERLYPPRNNNEEDVPEGLLDQMLNYQRGVHPKGFKPHACLEEIGKCLAYFPVEERIELERIIGNGSNLRTKWVELGEAMQRIYTRHLQHKNRDKAQLDGILDEASTWVQEKTMKYNLVKADDHSKMRDEMGAISTGVAALKKDAEKMRVNLSVSLPSRAYKACCTLLAPVVGSTVGFTAAGYISMVTGPLLGLVTGPVGAVVGSFAASALTKWKAVGIEVEEKDITETEKAFSWGSIAKKAGLIAGKVGLAYWAVPAAAAYVGTSAATAGYASLGTAVATAGYAGFNGAKVALSATEDRIFDQVWEKYDAAYKFVLQPRIYKATTTRAMAVLAK